MSMVSKEQKRLRAVRLQREFRERRKSEMEALRARQREDDVLRDSIKLSESFGDPMAHKILEGAPGLNAPALSAFFLSRAEVFKLSRKSNRATKKNTAGKKGAAVFL
jgi:hypothetical protein